MHETHQSLKIVHRADLRVNPAMVLRVEAGIGIKAFGWGENLYGLKSLFYALIQLLSSSGRIDGDLVGVFSALFQSHYLDSGGCLPPSLSNQMP